MAPKAPEPEPEPEEEPAPPEEGSGAFVFPDGSKYGKMSALQQVDERSPRPRALTCERDAAHFAYFLSAPICSVPRAPLLAPRIASQMAHG